MLSEQQSKSNLWHPQTVSAVSLENFGIFRTVIDLRYSWKCTTYRSTVARLVYQTLGYHISGKLMLRIHSGKYKPEKFIWFADFYHQNCLILQDTLQALTIVGLKIHIHQLNPNSFRNPPEPPYQNFRNLIKSSYERSKKKLF